MNEAIRPLSFGASLTAPAATTAGAAVYLADPVLRSLVDFFRAKGLEAVKREDREEVWYEDWLKYQAEHQLYARLIAPAAYSTLGSRFDLLRLTRFLEAFAYFSPAHGYSLHVSFLGLFPILMGGNEALKAEAVRALEAGGLFAFAVSERSHGSDLQGNEFTVRPADSRGQLSADGEKYYIGNANAASIISVLAKEVTATRGGDSRRASFMFFALRPKTSPAMRHATKIRTFGVRAAFVGGFEVRGHEFPESDVMSRGRPAWDAVFGTVNLGKFFLGFGSIGICERALEEALTHVRGRVLFGRPVVAMPHIRALTVRAYARLLAMKLYAYRALDYFQTASADDRRYLLFGAVQKARVSTQGVRVIDLLSECVGAKGFESETYFEMALRDVRLIPGLEGSTHINDGVTAQFIDAYLLDAAGDVQPPAFPESLVTGGTDSRENAYLMRAEAAGVKGVRFPPFGDAYVPWRALPNVRLFVRQIQALRDVVRGGGFSGATSRENADRAVALGKTLAVVVYAQLVAEHATLADVPPPVVSVIFHELVGDLAAQAAELGSLPGVSAAERRRVRRLLTLPRNRPEDVQAVAELMTGAS